MAPNTSLPPSADAWGGACRKAKCTACSRLRSTLRKLLTRQDWDDIDLAALARAADMQTEQVQRHYPSVIGCAIAALEEAVEACRQALHPRSAPHHDRAERFHRIADSLLDWVSANPHMAHLIFVVSQRTADPALWDALGAAKHRFVALFEEHAPCTPAGWTHIEFMVGLFSRILEQQLDRTIDRAELGARLHALAPFAGHRRSQQSPTDL